MLSIPLACAVDERSNSMRLKCSVSTADSNQGTVSGGGTYSEGSRVNISATVKSVTSSTSGMTATPAQPTPSPSTRTKAS